MALGPSFALCLAGLAALAVASLGSKVTDRYYTPVINMDQPGLIQEFPILLDVDGQIGSTSKPARVHRNHSTTCVRAPA